MKSIILLSILLVGAFGNLCPCPSYADVIGTNYVKGNCAQD